MTDLAQSDLAQSDRARLHLTKHHGLGNDFLVALLAGPPQDRAAGKDHSLTDRVMADGPELARWLCDRRRGIGADGLILAPLGPQPGTDAAMILFNPDGSRAEMSGNGIRCLGQALAMHLMLSGGTALLISTDAGPRHLQLQSQTGDDPHTLTMRVGMGLVGPGPQWQPSAAAIAAVAELQGPNLPPTAASTHARVNPSHPVAVGAVTASIGNPHLVVLVEDPWTVDLAHFGPLLEADFPAGINVEFIAPRHEPSETGPASALDLAVWERGAGITEACGTGATAAATVAHRWGLVGPSVAVNMPGGTVEVTVENEQSHLCGPSTFVAHIEVDLA